MFLFVFTIFMSKAQALSCPYGISNSFPSHNHEDPLPSNFQGAVWTYDTRNSSMDWRIRNDNGDYFGVDEQEIEHSGYEQVFQYSSPDLPADTYTVELEFEFEGLFTFAIGVSDIPDLEAPKAPIYLDYERRTEEDEWGIWDSLAISLEPAVETVMYRLETASDASFENAKLVQKTELENKGFSLWERL